MVQLLHNLDRFVDALRVRGLIQLCVLESFLRTYVVRGQNSIPFKLQRISLSVLFKARSVYKPLWFVKPYKI